jgi:hypothetical protein
MLKIYRFIESGLFDGESPFFSVVSTSQDAAYNTLSKYLEDTYGYDPEEGLDLYMEFKDEHDIKEGVII